VNIGRESAELVITCIIKDLRWHVEEYLALATMPDQPKDDKVLIITSVERVLSLLKVLGSTPAGWSG